MRPRNRTTSRSPATLGGERLPVTTRPRKNQGKKMDVYNDQQSGSSEVGPSTGGGQTEQQGESASVSFPRRASDEPANRELRRELHESTGLMHALHEDIAGLKELFRTASGGQQEIESLRLQCRELEEKTKAMECAKRLLESQLAGIQKPLEVSIEEHARAKASFRVDMYSRQGNGGLKGRIEHLLTKEKRIFDGLDAEVIAAFITAHLPEGALRRDTIPTPTDQLKIDNAGAIHTMALAVIPAGATTPTSYIPCGQSFKAILTVDKQTMGVKEGTDLGCTASLQAKPLGGGAQLYLGGYSGNLSPEGTVTLAGSTSGLTPGFYRFIARLTVHQRENTTQSLNIAQVNSLISVY